MKAVFDGVVLLALPIMFVVGLRRPDRLLMMWLLLTPLQDDTIFFGANFRVLSFDRLAMLMSVLSLAGSGRLRDLIPQRFSGFEKLVFLFIAMFLLGGFVSFDFRGAFSMFTQSIDLFIIPFYLYFLLRYLLLKESQDGPWGGGRGLEGNLAIVLGVVGVYLSGMGVFEQVTKIDLLERSARGLRGSEENEMVRANGPFSSPGVYGMWVNFILLYVVYRWRWLKLAGQKVAKWITVPFTGLMIGGIYAVMFRNMWGGALGAYLMQTGLNPRLRKKFVVGMIVAVIVGAASWGVLSQTQLYQERLSNVSNIHDRLNAWAYAFRAFGEHPLVGLGYGQLKFYIRGAQEAGDDLRWFDDVPATYHPHNTVIAMLGENGILLTVPFLLMLGRIVWKAMQCIRWSRTPQELEFSLFAFGNLFAMLAPHMTDRCLTWAKYNLLLFVLFGMIAAYHYRMMNPAEFMPLDEESEDLESEGESEPGNPANPISTHG